VISLKVRSVETPRPGPAGAELFFAAALPCYVLYVRTLAPTVTSEDSGELITAAYTLGIAHPPGYPLWCILGKLSSLIPLGNVAWRVSLLSAVLGAASVGLLALIAYRFVRNGWIALLAAYLFGVTRDFWGQSVVAEVYTLNVFFVLFLLWLILRFEDALKTRWLYLLAFAVGLGLTSHSTIGPLAAIFFGWVFLRHLYLFLRPILMVNLAASFLLGLSVILYLPIRSATDPVMDWGKPETISAMLEHFLRKQYAAAKLPRERTVLGQLTLVYHFLGSFALQFTPPVAALAVLGAAENWRREKKTFVLLALLFGLTTYGFMWLLNYPPDRENLHLTRVFFLPAYAVAAVWIAVAMARIAEWAKARFPELPRSRTFALASAGALMVLAPVAFHFEANDQSQNYLAEDWGRNILHSLKPNSIILPSADHSTFPLIYLQTVEGLRKDVVIGDKYGYIEDRVFRDLFKGKDPPRVAPPLGAGPHEKQRYLIERSGKPVYLTTKTQIEGLESHELVTWGLIFEAAAKGTKPDEAAHRRLWDRFRFHPGQIERRPGDFSQDLILSDYHYARARHALLFGRFDEATAALRRSEEYGFGIKEIHNNLGGTLAEAGKAEQALPFLRNALAVDPDYDMATRNMANALFSLKRYREGLPYFERMMKLDPENPLPHLGKARMHKERGELASAYFEYLPVLERDPQSEPLREEVLQVATAIFGKDSPLTQLVAEKPKRPRMRDPDDEFGAAEPRALSPPLATPIDPLSVIQDVLKR